MRHALRARVVPSGECLRGNFGQDGSCHSWINVWVAGNTV